MISEFPNGGARVAITAFAERLLLADWEAEDGPLRLRDDLELTDLANAPFFHNARLLLQRLASDGGAQATAAGNLNRTFTRRLFDEMLLPSFRREMAASKPVALNEEDVRPLHIARIVCQCGKLVAKRKQRFHATRYAIELLPDARSGQLYRRLFLAFFRKLDLHYLFPWRDVPGIQQTLAPTLWVLAHVAADWISVHGLPATILHPGVLDQLEATKYPHDTDEWIFAGYLLNPLLDFGLIEPRTPDTFPGIDDKATIRITPLFRRFIEFHGAP